MQRTSSMPPKTSNHWVSKSIISWIRKPRSFLRKPSVTGLRPLSSLAPTDILTAHTVPVRCCLPTEAHSVFRRQAEAAVFQPSALTPPACGNLFSPWFMPFFFFIVLPGALPDPRIKLPNLTKPLGDGTEIRVGGKACAHNVGKEMAYPSLWKRAHFPVAAT